MRIKNRFIEYFKTQKSSDETLTFKVSDSLEEARAKLSARIPFLKSKAISDALRNIPDRKSEILGSTEEEFRQQSQNVIDDAHKTVGQSFTELKMGIKAVSQKLNTFDLDSREKESRKVNQPQEDLDIASARAESESEELKLDEEILKLERERADLTEEVYLEQLEGENRPTKSILHSRWVYFSLMGLLIVMELPINWLSALALGETTDFLNMIFCFSLGLAISISSHFFGEGLVEHNKVEMGGGLLVGVFTILTILFIRYSIGYAAILGLFNVALFLTGSLLSYSRAKNLGYFEKDSELEKISIEFVAKKKERKLTHNILAKNLADLEEKYRMKAKNDAWSEIEELETQLKKSNVEYRKLKIYLKGYELSIQDIFEEGINVYRTTNSRQRYGRYPDVEFWKRKQSIPSLSFNYLKKKDLKKSKASKMGTSIIPMLGLFILSSCTPNNQAEIHSEVRVLLDKTDEILLDDEASIKHIERVSGLQSENVNAGVKVTMSTITSNTFNPLYQVEIEKEKNFFNGKKSNDRKKQRESFRDSLRSVFEEIVNEPVGRKESEVYVSICRELNELAYSTAKTKKLIILSDLLEHTSEISFYSYRNDRAAFLRDRDSIIDRFKQDCTFPNLEGIDIQVIHLPDESTDHLFIMALDFWKLLFEEHGAESFTHYSNV